MNTEAFPRIVILVVCINVTLMAMGFHLYDDGSDVKTATNTEINYSASNITDMSPSREPGFFNWSTNIIGSVIPGFETGIEMLMFVLGQLVFLVSGGFIVLMRSMGAPVALQWMVGVPITIASILYGLQFFKELLRK